MIRSVVSDFALKDEELTRYLNLIQGIAIILTSISVFDLGYSNFVENGILFNYLLFDQDKQPRLIKLSAFWDIFQFWGYCFLIVGISQFLKAIDLDKLDNYGLKSGKIAISLFLGTPLVTLAIIGNEYNFRTNAISSSVDYGWVPSITISWGFMICGLFATIYFLRLLRLELLFVKSIKSLNFISVILWILSAIIFFFIGLTIPQDQPFSHSFAGNWIWYFIVIGILLTCISKYSEVKNISVFGFLISMLILLVIYIGSITENIIPLWVLQMFAGLFIGIWFIFFQVVYISEFRDI